MLDIVTPPDSRSPLTVTETAKTVGKIVEGLGKGPDDAVKSIGDAVEGLGGLFGEKK